jgi:hypothetical protein
MANYKSGSERYNDRMNKIWETAHRLEKERIGRGERLNENLTDPDSLPKNHPSRVKHEQWVAKEAKSKALKKKKENSEPKHITRMTGNGTPERKKYLEDKFSKMGHD